MAKGQKKNSREAKKPKQEKPKPVAGASSFARPAPAAPTKKS